MDPISYSWMHWTHSLSINVSSIPHQDFPSLSCVMFEEGCQAKLSSLDKPSRTWWKGFHLVIVGGATSHKRMPIVPSHNSGGLNIVEWYIDKQHHMGANIDFIVVSIPPSLRAMILLKLKSMLGPYPNLPTLGYRGVNNYCKRPSSLNKDH